MILDLIYDQVYSYEPRRHVVQYSVSTASFGSLEPQTLTNPVLKVVGEPWNNNI